MSFARLFNQSSDVLTSTAMPDPADGYNNEFRNPIDLSSKEVVIGIACIATGMASFLALFCLANRSLHNKKQMLYRVIIRRSHATSIGEALSIPLLKSHRELSEDDKLLIEDIGLMAFAKIQIDKINLQKLEDDEDIELSSKVEEVVKVFLEKEKKFDYEKHDLPMDVLVDINYRTKVCSVCEFIIPPTIRATYFFELAFGIVVSTGSLQLMPTILPVSRDTNNSITIAQTALSTLFGLVMIYVNPTQAFTADLGSKIDNFFIHLFKKKKAVGLATNPLDKLTRTLIVTMTASKIFLVTMLLNNLYTTVIQDYVTTISLNDRINMQTDSIYPDWVVYLCSMIEFCLNQVNDPIDLITNVLIGFTLIDLYFRMRHKRNLEKAIVLDKVVVEDPPILNLESSAALRRSGQFASRTPSLEEFTQQVEVKMNGSLNTPLLKPSG